MKTKSEKLASIFLAAIGSARLLQAAVNFSNPVLPGDFPDPSIVRVGEDYWATATSSEWAPLFPILHSRDLVNWELKGNIFEKKPAWSSKNYWAPEISHYKGKFYVYYVGRKKGTGPLSIAVATAENPTGPWTDHGPLIGQDEGSIDAMAVSDESDERFLIWKADGNSRRLPTILYAQHLSEDGTKLTGNMKEILRNDTPWEGSIIEGPFVQKRGDWFYIFYAGGNGCCGKQCNYGTGVARSKKLLGPFEKYSGNPILASNDTWKCPGHGSIVTTADGRDFFLCHAYDARSMNYVGREGVLNEIKWNKDGWPIINDDKGVSSLAVSPHGKVQRSDLEFVDDFATTNLNLRWQWPHSREPRFKIEKGELILNAPASERNDLFGSVIAVQTTAGNYAATALVDVRDMPSGARAGLFAFGDVDNALGVTLGNGKVTLLRRQKNKTETLGGIDSPAFPKIYLRMEAKDGHRFQFMVWTGSNWKSVGENLDLEGDYLPPWDRGVRIALTVGGSENATAKFD